FLAIKSKLEQLTRFGAEFIKVTESSNEFIDTFDRNPSRYENLGWLQTSGDLKYINQISAAAELAGRTSGVAVTQAVRLALDSHETKLPLEQLLEKFSMAYIVEHLDGPSAAILAGYSAHSGFNIESLIADWHKALKITGNSESAA